MRFKFCLLLVLLMSGTCLPVDALTIDFEDLPFPTHPLRYIGEDGAGGFEAGGATFSNESTDFGGGSYSWQGFAYSRETEVPPLDTSTMLWNYQYVALPGGGSQGSSTYIVAFSGIDGGEGTFLSQITLPSGALPKSVDVTNVAYAALSLRNGDSFGKKFGGPSGTDPDWFRMDIVGLDAHGEELGRLPYYLADYRGDHDFIVDTWETLDLTPLALPGIASLAIRFDSSDRAETYLNTPAYAALDNLVLSLPLTGDYNRDGRVDAADYVVWRNTLGSTDNLAADGNRSGQIDIGDYLIWKEAYTAPSAGLSGRSVPEPDAGLLALVVFIVGVAVRHVSKA